MKAKTHSGAKKRIKVRNSGSIKVEKAARRHLLMNKSKCQKAKGKTGIPVHSTKMKVVRKLMAGKV